MSDQHEPPRRYKALSYSDDPYGSSNAQNYAGHVGHQVNPRTGTLQVSISPPHLFGFLGAAATPGINTTRTPAFSIARYSICHWDGSMATVLSWRANYT